MLVVWVSPKPAPPVAVTSTVSQLLTLELRLTGLAHAVERTLLVPDTYSAYELHLCIQVALGWEDLEGFEFVGSQLTVGTEATFAGEGLAVGGHRYQHADEVTLDMLFGPLGERVSYTYDFARFRTATLTLVAREWSVEELPSCTHVSGAAPPESLDDPEDLPALQAAYERPDDGLYAVARAVLGEDYDPAPPSAADVTTALEELFAEEIEPYGTEGEDDDDDDDESAWWDPARYDESMRLRVLREEIDERLADKLSGASAAERQASLLAALRARG